MAVSKVELWANGSLAMTQILNPAQASFNITLSWPMYTISVQIQAKAYDTSGNVGVSNVIGVSRIGRKATPVSLVRFNSSSPQGVVTVNDEAEASSSDGKIKALVVSPAQGYNQALQFDDSVENAKILRINGSTLMEANKSGSPLVIHLQSTQDKLPEAGLYIIQTQGQQGSESVPLLLIK
ncbi:MAG: hypothetical protein HY399_09110 [Elusimicrobia bacterium]|nr:hypothetical protein [Elusimicrobiota bacterium]